MRKPFYKKSHKGWFVHFQGRMVRLAPAKEEAFRKYHELMVAQAPVSSTEAVASLLNCYLDWCRSNRAADTYDFYRYLLSSFTRSIGLRLRIGNLQPLHVTEWLDNHPNWNATTRFNAVRAVKRAFNWAVKEGRLSESPLRRVEQPAPTRREAFVSREQFKLLLDHATGECFKDYLNFLFETGARPQEVKVIEAKHCDLAANRIVLPASKAKGKKFPRVIYFTALVHRIISRLCKSNPDGPIFRNHDGLPWCKDSINCRMRRLRVSLKKKKMSIEGLCATALRHGFATEALKKGVDPVTVSILMGHSDATMVSRTYQHLAADANYLAQALRKATGVHA